MFAASHRDTGAMTETVLHHAASGSPNSSEEIGSHQGTPETKLTAFSPEELRAQPNLSAYGLVKPNVPPAFSLGKSQGKSSPINLSIGTLFGSQDPFVSASGSASAIRSSNLSPTASSFTPFNLQQNGFAPGGPRGLNPFVSQPENQNDTFGGDSILKTPTVAANLHSEQDQVFLGSQTYSNPLASTQLGRHLTIEVVPPKIGNFSSESETSRSLMICQISRKTTLKEIDEFFSVWKTRLKLKGPSLT